MSTMGSKLMEPIDIETYASIFDPKGNYSSICMRAFKIQSKGIFNHTNPLEYSVPLLLLQLSIASLFILSTSWLLKPLGQPNMVVQLLGGLALGPSFLGRFVAFIETIFPIRSLIFLDTLGALGFMFYFFLIGVQMDPSILKRIEKKEFLIGFCSLALGLASSIFTSVIFIASGINVEAQILNSLPVVAIVSSVVGFPIVAQYLTELKMVNSEFGRMALMSVMVSNLFGFVVIFLTCMAKSSEPENNNMLRPLFSGIVLALVIAFIIRPIILWNLKRSPDGEPIKQNFICLIFVGVLVAGFCGKALGINPNVGPFLFGMAIPAGPPLGSALVEKLEFVNSWLLMPLYFVKNGLVIDIFIVKPKVYLMVQFVILIACIGKFVGAFFSALHSQVPVKDAIPIGLVTNFQGVLELGLFRMMEQGKVINNQTFVILCLSMVIVSGAITPILRYMYDPRRRYVIYKRRTLLDMKPGSQLQVLTCVHNQDNVWTSINLLEALHPSNHDPIGVSVLHLVELIGYSHPVLISHKLARNTSRKGSISRSIVKAFRIFEQSYYGVVSLHAFTAISPYTTMHDEVCTMALEKKTSLIVIPFHKSFISGKPGESLKVGVKIMNNKILEMAPCSVAILVDRGLVKYSRPVLESWSLYRVAVLFLGGPDDREAIAMAVRMVRRPNISLSIIRLFEKEDLETSCNHKSQLEMDNAVVNALRFEISGNNRIIYEEKVVNDATGTVTFIRSMEDQYDLVIVGRRHDTRSPLIRGLSDWDEYSELGTIGDLFASQDFQSSATILVVQQHVNALDEWHGVSKNYYDFYVSRSQCNIS